MEIDFTRPCNCWLNVGRCRCQEDSEAQNVGSLINQHKMCIEILEGIMHFQQRKKHVTESIEAIAGVFPVLHKKYLNDIDTLNRCIKRLEQRYKRVLNDANGLAMCSADLQNCTNV